MYIYIGWYHDFSVLKSRPRMLHSPVVLDSPTRNCGVVFSAYLISGVPNFDSSLHIQKDSFKKTQWTAPHTFLVDSVLQMLHAQSVVASQEFKMVLLHFHCPSERVDMIRPSASKFVHTVFFNLFPIVRLRIKMQHPPAYRSCPSLVWYHPLPAIFIPAPIANRSNSVDNNVSGICCTVAWQFVKSLSILVLWVPQIDGEAAVMGCNFSR